MISNPSSDISLYPCLDVTIAPLGAIHPAPPTCVPLVSLPTAAPKGIPSRFTWIVPVVACCMFICPPCNTCPDVRELRVSFTFSCVTLNDTGGSPGAWYTDTFTCPPLKYAELFRQFVSAWASSFCRAPFVPSSNR